jgi:hypothetical protein
MGRILAPKHLAPEARELWAGIQREYGITDTAGLRILRTACEAFQRAQECRHVIDVEGLQAPDRFGQNRPHVLLSAERDARSQFLQALKSLHLDVEPLKTVGRPPGR